MFTNQFTFNEQYYIYNYPRPPDSTHINPVRYAIVIAHDVLTDFFTLAIQIKDFNFNFPYNITLLVGNLALIIFLLSKRNYYLYALPCPSFLSIPMPEAIH